MSKSEEKNSPETVGFYAVEVVCANEVLSDAQICQKSRNSHQLKVSKTYPEIMTVHKNSFSSKISKYAFKNEFVQEKLSNRILKRKHDEFEEHNLESSIVLKMKSENNLVSTKKHVKKQIFSIGTRNGKYDVITKGKQVIVQNNEKRNFSLKEQKNSTCTICSAMFINESELSKHFAEAHKNLTNLDVEEKSNFSKRNGLIQCENKTCQMGFLSFKGWETHKKKCNGVLTEGVSIRTLKRCDF